MLEASMFMGRSCISIEVDGTRFLICVYRFVSGYQFQQSARRLKETYDAIIAECGKLGMDYTR